jgi:formylglycine-generating enzyme required for sulfatase activity
MKSNKKLDLLNSEGPCIYGIRTKMSGENIYIIYDQWNNEIAYMHRDRVQRFLEGAEELTDTRGKVWNWAKESEGMKPSPERLQAWLSDEETI